MHIRKIISHSIPYHTLITSSSEHPLHLRRKMKFQFIASFLMMQMSSSAAFAFAPNSIKTTTARSVRLNAVPTPEESAQALTSYMAKAHEAKIEALKDLENKKNAEIKALKESVGSAPVAAPAASASASDESVEELTQKLLSYQKFMADYIVKAQEDKARAVAETQTAISKKYEDKLNAFMLNAAPVNGAAAAAPAIAGVAATATDEPRLYQERNAKIAAAAKAGKSRWGDKEVERVGGGAKAPPSAVLSAAPVADAGASASSSANPPPEVLAADHGLRADGGVGGLSLAERVANGAASAAAPAAGVKSASNPSFDRRNAYIAAAAKAGKQNRWGIMEVEKAIEYSSNALPAAVIEVILPEIKAADHGLRADGGVGGPSLADRVNLGAKLLQ